MSPQCRQNALHVACVQKLNMSRRHVSCIGYMSPVSAVENRPLSMHPDVESSTFRLLRVEALHVSKYKKVVFCYQVTNGHDAVTNRL